LKIQPSLVIIGARHPEETWRLWKIQACPPYL